MRIVFLLSTLGGGGAERVAATLCNAWAQSGHEVTVVGTFSGETALPYPMDQRVKVVSLFDLVKTSRKTPWSYLLRLLALRKLIRERRADVVVSFLPNVNVAAILATGLTGMPVVISERSDPTSTPLPRVWRAACAVLYRFADAVVVQTASVQQSIVGHYPGLKRVVCVPNPLPREIGTLSVPATGRPRRVLLSLGRLVDQKQVDHAIRAFAAVAASHGDWDLHVYGDGPLAQELQALAARLGLQDRVMFQGLTDRPWAVMAAADAFVMPSAFEGFPNALLEAMGLGLPCVVYDCLSGPREITRDGEDALLVPLNDEAVLAQALGRMMEDDGLRQRLGERARGSVLARYELGAVLRRWDEVFTQVLGSNFSTRPG